MLSGPGLLVGFCLLRYFSASFFYETATVQFIHLDTVSNVDTTFKAFPNRDAPNAESRLNPRKQNRNLLCPCVGIDRVTTIGY